MVDVNGNRIDPEKAKDYEGVMHPMQVIKGDIFAEEKPGYWKQTERKIVRNYQYIHVDTVKHYLGGAEVIQDEQLKGLPISPDLLPTFVDWCLITNVEYGRFQMKEMYVYKTGKDREHIIKSVPYNTDFSITYPEPQKYYGAGDNVQLTYRTSTSVPSDLFQRTSVFPLAIEGGLCTERFSPMPMENIPQVNHLRNAVGDYKFHVKMGAMGTLVDLEEKVSAEMPRGMEYGDLIYLRLEASKDSVRANIYYTYEWTEGEMPVVKSADGDTGGSPAGDLVPVVLWIGGASGGAVVVLMNRNRLNGLFKKYGTSDTIAIRKIQIQNQIKDIVDGFKHKTDENWADTGVTVAKDTLKRDAVAFEVGLAYMSGGMSLKGKLLVTGGWSFLKTMAQRMEAGDSGGAALGKTVCKTLFDVAKTAFTSTKIPAMVKGIYAPFFDMFGDLPINGQTGFSGGYWGSTFMKNYINAAIDGNMPEGFGKASELTQKSVEYLSDYIWKVE